MKSKNLFFLFFLLSLISPINNRSISQNSICKVDSIEKFADCIKEGKSNFEIIYPIKMGNFHRYMFYVVSPKPTKNDAYVEFKSDTGNELIISRGPIGRWISSPFAATSSELIPSESIISWSNFGTDSFELKYLNEFGSEKNISIKRVPRSLKGNLLSMMLEEVSGLSSRSERSDYEIKNSLKNIFDRLDKRHEVIMNNIYLGFDISNNCIKIDQGNFPDLSKQLLKINRTKNQLVEKLSSEYSIDKENICS